MTKKKTTKRKNRSRKPRYRILSLDGGGIRGLITAVWLSRLEEKLGKPLHAHFDLIAGTSTGSILACAVSSGIEAQKIVDLYEDYGREVFPSRASRLWSRATRLFSDGPSAPKYDGKGLERVLRRQFGDATFADLHVKPTLITTYNTLTRTATVIKNTRDRFADIPVWEAVKASSSAPTYFPAHVLTIGGVRCPLVDGGVVANNPTACAIAEAIAEQKGTASPVELEDYVVASFGTGSTTRPISISEAREWGVLEWAVPVIDVLFDGAADATDYIADKLISDKRYFRFQTTLMRGKGYDDMDNVDQTNINALKATATRYLESEGGDKQLDDLVKLLK